MLEGLLRNLRRARATLPTREVSAVLEEVMELGKVLAGEPEA